MGSFYSTCSVSGMTLSHQKTSILLLSPNYNISYKEHLGMIVSNDGAQCFFSPFGFPIHGKYDDCGYLCDIQRDKNVEMLEEYFNLSIDQIIQNVGDDRWNKYDDSDTWKLKGLDGTDVKNKDTFLKLGMTYFRTEILEFLEKGWEKLIPVDDHTKHHTPQGLIKNLRYTLSLERGFNESPFSKMEKTEIFKSEHFNKLSKEERQFVIQKIMMGGCNIWNYDNCYIASLTKKNFFNELPVTVEQLNDFAKQYTMLRTLGWQLNKTLIPSNYGSQQTNWNKLLELNTITNELLKNDIKDNFKQTIEDYAEHKSFDKNAYEEDWGVNLTDYEMDLIKELGYKLM